VQSNQQNTTFAKLHERRVEAIAAVHEKLLRTLQETQQYIAAFELAGGPTRQEKLATLAKTYDELVDFIVKGQLFLPRPLADKVKRLESEYRRIANEFTIVVHANPGQPNIELWQKLNQDLQGTVMSAVEEAQEEMRVALGDAPAAIDPAQA